MITINYNEEASKAYEKTFGEKLNEINNNHMTTSQLKQYVDYLNKIRSFNSKPVMRKIKIITFFGK